MSKRTRRFLGVALAVLAMATAFVVGARPVAANDGQDLFVSVHKCNTCHSVDAAGVSAKSEKMKSTDLSGYKTDDIATLAKFLRKEEDRADGENHKKAFKGTDEELQTIVDWLGSLE